MLTRHVGTVKIFVVCNEKNITEKKVSEKL